MSLVDFDYLRHTFLNIKNKKNFHFILKVIINENMNL